MLCLLFQIGDNRYAIDAKWIIEVLPLLEPSGEVSPAGQPVVLMNYGGKRVPVVDLTALITGHPAPALMSTRIVMMLFQDQNGCQHQGGVIVENATDLLRKDPEDWLQPSRAERAGPFKGPILMDAMGPVQLVDHQELFPEELRRSLVGRSTPVV